MPFELVYADTFATRDQAIEAEFKIKKWTRRKKEALISQNWNQLMELSKKIFDDA
jgi:predicted GIY-YIG superfamily endonuclease